MCYLKSIIFVNGRPLIPGKIVAYTAVCKKACTKLNFLYNDFFLPLESNYEIHFSSDICSLAILYVEHTEI
jgi:hypothetical protein